ncbi:hypothetical protein [Streptomyces sp. Y1]|uniref:Uncharacterized protein n=1 Tax=Streptomyces sp. Y1 TaxID=3238634 RepID=A0AB39TJQ0_9ACTN
MTAWIILALYGPAALVGLLWLRAIHAELTTAAAAIAERDADDREFWAIVGRLDQHEQEDTSW